MAALEIGLMKHLAMGQVKFSDLSVDVDQYDFGLIGFDPDGAVQVYNQTESVAAGLSRERVIGRHVFESLAPCMNNFMVAQRFADALESGTPLDDTIDYVLTLRMRPTPVRLRLMAQPGERLRYVLVER